MTSSNALAGTDRSSLPNADTRKPRPAVGPRSHGRIRRLPVLWGILCIHYSAYTAAGCMTKTMGRIGILGFEGANAVDMVGPMEVFATAGRADCTRRESRGAYEIYMIGLTERPFAAESGIRLVPHCSLDDAPSVDTLIIPGGWGIREPATNAAVSAWLRTRAPRVRRVACVCTGVYGLAPTGLLDGRQVTTHWRFVEDLACRFPKVSVQGNALFLKDGRYYTSGGVTAGIDLALALIEEDLGPRVALAVARELVVYLKRAGGQEQYSEPLQFQCRSLDSFADLIAWICAHLRHDLSVTALAERVALSPRHFSRRFTAAVGCTPAEFVATARLSEARDRLTDTRRSIASIAAAVGFRSADVFRRQFQDRFGIAPHSYRERFAAVHLSGAQPTSPGVGLS
jgi:transcriptional regulator GlxA family with amidase domain